MALEYFRRLLAWPRQVAAMEAVEVVWGSAVVSANQATLHLHLQGQTADSAHPHVSTNQLQLRMVFTKAMAVLQQQTTMRRTLYSSLIFNMLIHLSVAGVQ